MRAHHPRGLLHPRRPELLHCQEQLAHLAPPHAHELARPHRRLRIGLSHSRLRCQGSAGCMGTWILLPARALALDNRPLAQARTRPLARALAPFGPPRPAQPLPSVGIRQHGQRRARRGHTRPLFLGPSPAVHASTALRPVARRRHSARRRPTMPWGLCHSGLQPHRFGPRSRLARPTEAPASPQPTPVASPGLHRVRPAAHISARPRQPRRERGGLLLQSRRLSCRHSRRIGCPPLRGVQSRERWDEDGGCRHLRGCRPLDARPGAAMSRVQHRSAAEIEQGRTQHVRAAAPGGRGGRSRKPTIRPPGCGRSAATAGCAAATVGANDGRATATYSTAACVAAL
eukprot:scaffold13842_cov115-Isochrysis_galbana.AAC.13